MVLFEKYGLLFEKYGQHQPLNRQADRYSREGVELSVSTLADQVGACTAVLAPLHDLMADHVLAAERLHGDDTTVSPLARGRPEGHRTGALVCTHLAVVDQLLSIEVPDPFLPKIAPQPCCDAAVSLPRTYRLYEDR